MIDPNVVSLITISDLSSPISQALSWNTIIEDPVSKIPYKLTAQQFYALMSGSTNLPDGVLSGLSISIGNGTTPKTYSITDGQWRISNIIYQKTTTSSGNIATADATYDRIDAFYADNTGAIGYEIGTPASVPVQPNIPIDSIRLSNILVKSDGSSITPPPSTPVGDAFMNTLNNGNFDITGVFKINGVQISNRAGLTFTFPGSSVVNGSINLASQTGMPLAGSIPFTLMVFADDVDYSNSSSYTPSTRVLFGGFSGTETLITIKIIF